MITLTIIITGKGRIPRLGSIGPKLTPTEVPLETLEAIVRAPFTPGAAYRGEDGTITQINHANYQTVFEKYARDAALASVSPTTPVTPVVIAETVAPVVETPPVVVEAHVAVPTVVETPPVVVEAAVIEIASPTVETPPAVAETETAAPVTEVPVVETETAAPVVETPAATAASSVEEDSGFKRITKPDDNRNNGRRR